MRKLLVGVVVLAACGGEGAPPTGSTVQAVGSCTPLVLPSLIEGEWDGGEVTVSSGSGEIVVSLATTANLFIGSIDVYAGTGPVPVDASGAADPSQFGHHVAFDRPVQAGELHVPLAGLGLSCGDPLRLAIRSGVGYVDSGTGLLLGEQAGWTGGEAGFEYEPCCSEEEPAPGGVSCTRTIGAWKHETDWPVESLVLGSTTYPASALRALLGTAPRGDATVILAHQAIAAKLNVAAGVAAPAEVAQAIADADAWFDENGVVQIPGKIAAGCAAAREATRISALLDAFNQGLAGVDHCE